MKKPEILFDESHCEQCACGEGLDFSFTFAFQPIVDVPRVLLSTKVICLRGPVSSVCQSRIFRPDVCPNLQEA
mgnify:FL=1